MTIAISDRITDRFWRHVDVRDADECWEWTAGRLPTGYGRFRGAAKMIYAHRYALSLRVGPLAPDVCALHRCDNPPCVNPNHLFPGSLSDNSKDREAKGRGRVLTGAANGHSKLTPPDVRAIRGLVASGTTQTAAAALYGVSGANVSEIISRKIWAHVE